MSSWSNAQQGSFRAQDADMHVTKAVSVDVSDLTVNCHHSHLLDVFSIIKNVFLIKYWYTIKIKT